MKPKILTAVSLIWLLSLAITAVIYLAWLLFPLAIQGFDLVAASGRSSSVIMTNINALMHYLTSPFIGQLVLADFALSASGLKHFADVKGLFMLAQACFFLLLYPSLRFLMAAFQGKFFWQLKRPLGFCLSLPLIIGGLGLVIGFDTFFVLFHQLLFPGDSSWLFNPATDPIILVLPETFFLACFVGFFLLYEFLLLALYLLAKKQEHQLKTA